MLHGLKFTRNNREVCLLISEFMIVYSDMG